MNIETLIGFGRHSVDMEEYTGKILSIIPFAITPSESEHSLILAHEFATNGLSIIHVNNNNTEEFKLPKITDLDDVESLVDFIEKSISKGVKPTFRDATVSDIVHELITTVLSKLSLCNRSSIRILDKEFHNTLVRFDEYKQAYETVEVLIKENGMLVTEENVRSLDEVAVLDVILKSDPELELKYLLERELLEYGRSNVGVSENVALVTKFLEVANEYARVYSL